MSLIKAVQDKQLNYLIGKLNEKFDGKVSVETGKGLSEANFTQAEKDKLLNISAGAEVNQNAFSSIKIGDSVISADAKTDELVLFSGDNATVEAYQDGVKISAKDTTYSFATGTANGTITVTPSEGEAKEVAVKGLGSAAYTSSSDYDVAGAAEAVLGTAADGAEVNTVYGAKAAAAAASAAAATAQGVADAAMPIAGGAFTGAVSLVGDPTENLHAATKKYVDDAKAAAISAGEADATTKADAALASANAYTDNAVKGLSGAMHFRGSKDELPTDNTGFESGDVILVGAKEYVFDGEAWKELGDEGSYVLKTQKINGHVLSGDITLTPTDIGADAAGTAQGLIEALDYTYEGTGDYVTGVSQEDGKISVTKGTLPTTLPNANAISFKNAAGTVTKSYTGIEVVEITAADLGAVTDISGLFQLCFCLVFALVRCAICRFTVKLWIGLTLQ